MPEQNDSTETLRIGVIGAGWLGGTVGRLWAKAGHEVFFSTRHPEKLASMVKSLGPRGSAGTPREAAEFGTVLLFAIPYDELPQTAKDLADAVRGKIVMDACNPYEGDPKHKREVEAAGVAETSARLLAGSRLVRAFSAVDATAVESSAKRTKDKLGVPLASDDADAIRIAAQLVRDAGCEPVEVGNLSTARTFQRGGPGFRANTDAAKLRRLLGL